MDAARQLIEIIGEIARGKYSNDIMALTADGQPEPVRTVAEAVGMMMVKIEAREYQLEMMVEELKGLNRKIKKNTIKTLSAMAQALAARDTYTMGHAARVGELAGRMARHMGLDKEAAEKIRIAGILHDIGKIGFPDHLFHTHDSRTPPEVINEIVKHPGLGARILKELDFLGPAVDYVHCHHERPDGKGYPRNLKAPEIPLGAMILAVADAYDAMTTDRSYQKAMSQGVAVGILKENAGTKWDTGCVAALEAVHKDPA